MITFAQIVVSYVCPTLGSILASIMFAAPVADLRAALITIAYDSQQLNTRPWTWGQSNCLGWTLYGFMRKDPFVTAANVPGLILYVWMNSAASRLQYVEMAKTHVQKRQGRLETDADSPLMESDAGLDDLSAAPSLVESAEEGLVIVPQEQSLLQLLILWAIVMVYCTWFTLKDPTEIVGTVVNLNLIVFYGAPLQTIREVLATSNAQSIHGPSMIMTITNTTFWALYGLAQRDYYIIVPNTVGLSLGLLQGLLKCMYPSRRGDAILQPESDQRVHQHEAPEEELPPNRSMD
jgi:solute carrier family 50 (sugar transporter)